MSNDLGNLKEQFFRDSEDILEHIESVLLAAESGEVNAEALDGLFRDFHTLKGNAGMVGEADIQALCHAVETILDPIRKGRGELTSNITQQVFEVIDILRQAVEAVDSDVVRQELQHKLESLSRGGPESQSSSPQKEPNRVVENQNETSQREDVVSESGSERRSDSSREKVVPATLCSLAEFRYMYKLFHPIDRGFTRLGEEREDSENAQILEEMGVDCIELQDGISEQYTLLKSLSSYLEKLLVLLIRNDIVYDPFSFELLERLIDDFRNTMLGILRGADFMIEVPIPNMRSLAYLEEVLDAGKEIIVVRLQIPYKKFVSYEDAFQLLQRLYRTEKHYIIFVLSPNETVSKVTALLNETIDAFPDVYESVWSGLQELLVEKKGIKE